MDIQSLKDSFEEIRFSLKDLFQRVSQLEAAPTITSSSGGGAPVDAEYLTLSLNGVLTNERRFVPSARFNATDSGANNNYTLDLAVSGVGAGTYGDAINVSQVTVDTYGRITNAANVLITGVPPLSHALLGNTYHSDVVNNTPTRGGIVYGNSTLLWDELPIGGINGSVLTRNATDVLWSAGGLSFGGAFTLTVSGNSTISGSLIGNMTGGGTVVTGGFTGTIQATADFGMGAGTLTATTANNTATATHTHAITNTTDGTSIGTQTIAAFNASGQITVSDLFTNDGGTFGISGNELLTVNAAGTFVFSGADVGIGLTPETKLHIDAVDSAGSFAIADSTMALGEGVLNNITFRVFVDQTNEYVSFETVKFGVTNNRAFCLNSQGGDVGIGSTVRPTANGGAVLFMGLNAADPTMATNTVGFYGKDVSGSGEAFAVAEDGTVAQLTAHNKEIVPVIAGMWCWHPMFSNEYLGIRVDYDMELLIQDMENLTGNTYKYVTKIQKRNWNNEQRERQREASKRGETYKMKTKPVWMNTITEV